MPASAARGRSPPRLAAVARGLLQPAPVADPPTDVALLQAWRAGDNQAGNALLERHFFAIYRFFDRNVGEDVEDLTQRTFEGCIARRDHIEDDASFRAYLFGIARKQLLKHLHRRSVRGAPITPSQASLLDNRTSPSGAVAKHDRQALFVQGLETLGPEFRGVLERFYWEDRSLASIAEEMGVAVGTVKSRLHRAKQQMRAFFESAQASAELVESAVTALERDPDEPQDP